VSKSSAGKNVIARRYGRVLFQLAEEQKKTKEVMKDISLLASMVKNNASIWTMVINPTVPHSSQLEIVNTLAKSLELEKITANFLQVLVERDRLLLLDRIMHHFTEAYKLAHDEIDATLKSAISIPSCTLDDLTKSLKKNTGYTVKLHHEVEPSLLGGVVLQIGSLMVDASVGSRLSKLRQTMKG
jgi:F-type H+-transporting ATPase subunit delta